MLKLFEPRIDILMATFNGEHYVGEQIESIQRQGYRNWRLLVSDDCSTDGTVDVVRRYARTDSRIYIVSDGLKHGGAKQNFFSLLGRCDAPYCMFCDQDDVWLPFKVEITLKAMRRIEEELATELPCVIFTDMKVVDGNLNVVDDSFEHYSSIDPARTKFSQVIAQSLGAGCTMMINEASRDAALRLETLDGVVMHDWWLTLIAAAFGRIGHIDEPTLLYRQHGSNEVGALEYSPVKRVGHFDLMKKSVSATVLQAHAFLDCYSDLLGSDMTKVIREYVAMGHSTGFTSIWHLVRSGCWKKGLRKFGQLAVSLRGAN